MCGRIPPYFPFSSIESAVEKLSETVAKQQEVFLECLEYPTQQVSGGCAVVMEGRMVGSLDDEIPKTAGWRSKTLVVSFYFEHGRDLLTEHFLLKKSTTHSTGSDEPIFEETIPLVDYLLRYDLGAVSERKRFSQLPPCCMTHTAADVGNSSFGWRVQWHLSIENSCPTFHSSLASSLRHGSRSGG